MGSLLHQDLTTVQGKGLHESAQNIPVRQAELTTQGVAGLAVDDGLGQTLDVKTDGGGEWCVHGGKDTCTPQAQQDDLTISYK